MVMERTSAYEVKLRAREVNAMSLSLEERVIQLTGLIEKGKFLEAIEEFYAQDAVMQDNEDPPRVGLANILAHERKVMAAFTMHVNRADSFLVDGDRAAIKWIYEYTDARGRRHRLNEVAYQEWRDGKIVRERFYCDPAQMRVEITPEGWPFERLEPRAPKIDSRPEPVVVSARS
jgi:ketosteroid isomerase-like protein